MKRVRVYKEIISDENLRLAIQEVNAGHRRNGNHSLNKKVIEIENNMDEYVEKLRAFIQGRKSASGFAEEKAAAPPSALTISSGIPIRTRLHDLAKAQSIPAQAIASSLLLPARQEPSHLV